GWAGAVLCLTRRETHGGGDEARTRFDGAIFAARTLRLTKGHRRLEPVRRPCGWPTIPDVGDGRQGRALDRDRQLASPAQEGSRTAMTWRDRPQIDEMFQEALQPPIYPRRKCATRALIGDRY